MDTIVAKLQLFQFFVGSAQLLLQIGHGLLGLLQISLSLLQSCRARGSLQLSLHQLVLGLQHDIRFVDLAQVAFRAQHLLLQVSDHLQGATLLGQDCNQLLDHVD